MYKYVGIIALSALLSSVGALAAGSLMSFSELDMDEDGVITKQEAKDTPLTQKFQKSDVDSDSNISQAEFALFEKQKQIKKESAGGSQQKQGSSSQKQRGGSQ